MLSANLRFTVAMTTWTQPMTQSDRVQSLKCTLADFRRLKSWPPSLAGHYSIAQCEHADYNLLISGRAVWLSQIL